MTLKSNPRWQVFVTGVRNLVCVVTMRSTSECCVQTKRTFSLINKKICTFSKKLRSHDNQIEFSIMSVLIEMRSGVNIWSGVILPQRHWCTSLCFRLRRSSAIGPRRTQAALWALDNCGPRVCCFPCTWTILRWPWVSGRSWTECGSSLVGLLFVVLLLFCCATSYSLCGSFLDVRLLSFLLCGSFLMYESLLLCGSSFVVWLFSCCAAPFLMCGSFLSCYAAPSCCGASLCWAVPLSLWSSFFAVWLIAAPFFLVMRLLLVVGLLFVMQLFFRYAAPFLL